MKQRRAQKAKLADERQKAIDQETERIELRDEQLEKAKEEFAEQVAQQKANRANDKGSDEEQDDEEEDPEFEEENFLLKFDDDNPPIEIPAEVIQDIDNDFNLEEEEEEAEK